MKKVLTIAAAALLAVGMTAAIAGECGGCSGDKSDKDKEKSSVKKTVACSSEQKAECPASKSEKTEETQKA